MYIKDLTPALREYKMNKSVRFGLSYDSLKCDFIALKVESILIENVLSRTAS